MTPSPVTDADLVALGETLQWGLAATFEPKQADRHQIVARARVILPFVADDVTAQILGRLALELVGAIEDVAATRDVLAQTTALAHTQHQTIRQLRGQLRQLRESQRTQRWRATATTEEVGQ